MDEFKGGNNVGLSPEGPQHVGKSAAKYAQHSGGRVRKGGALLIALLIIVVLTTSVSWLVWSLNDSRNKANDKGINQGEFQALFLTNGQVYFGKLSDLGDKYVTLTDIYYLQVQQASTAQQSVQPASGTTANSQVSLAKLGSELHGPEDKMQVSSQQVLFWENLKNNSKVVQAIDKYQTK